MNEDHVEFFGLVHPYRPDSSEFRAMELGFMWCAVHEFMVTLNQVRQIICVHESHGPIVMQMADVTGLHFKARDGCRHDQIHILFSKVDLDED
jgi:hypothetical protein